MSGPIPPPSVTPARLVPRLALPSYRYVPGVLPHPTRHEGGHGCPGEPTHHADWWRCEAYAYGIDLLNARYPWEAHEVWEHRWYDTEGPWRAHLQALVQIAASLLKRHLGHGRPADLLAQAARDKLDRVRAAHGPVAYGADLDALSCALDVHPPAAWPTVSIAWGAP